ncbi:MAG: hypothetical protein ACLP59_13860 [Bryobacteraceae bacterium]
MTPVTLNSSLQGTYAPTASPKPRTPDQTSGDSTDNVQFSPAALREAALTGRVAVNAEEGNLASGEAQQAYGQIASIHSQIVADRQANGGTLSTADAAAIQQSQNQLSQTIYGDAHGGAAAPTGAGVPRANQREAVQAGRIVLNEKAGNLSGDQAQELGSQLGAIHQQVSTDEQANGGSLSASDAQAINQLQNQLSQQIYENAHGVTPGQS